MDGWGIGFFRNGRAHVEKSAERIYVPGQLHDSFQRLARVIRSLTIIAHIRFQTSGKKDECHAHPFVLNFLGTDWVFAHNGKAPAIEAYRSPGPRLDAESDSARTFEYLRDYLRFYIRTDPTIYTLFEALRRATSRLMCEYPGGYNYLLTNGSTLFAFTNHRRFMILKGSQQLESSLLLTTVSEGLSPEPWHPFKSGDEEAEGLLLLITGGELVLTQAVSRP
jgi:predicted glutamine amidotransferase